MRLLIASVAAIALISGGAMAQPGDNKGNGSENRKAGPASGKPGGNGKTDARGAGRPERPNVGARPGGDPARKAAPQPQRAGNEDRRGNSSREGDRGEARPAAAPISQRYDAKGREYSNRGNRIRQAQEQDRDFDPRDGGFAVFRDYDRRSLAYEGCPPGLAKKRNGCMPPGLAKQQPVWRPAFFGYDGFGSTRFYYNEGFLIRLGGDGRIAASIPLLGGALAIGNPWPEFYRPVELSPYYSGFYGLEPDGYRYANNVIYRVDPETAAITSIAALLTGDDFIVGEPAPLGYDVYNIPYNYRDRYRDGPDGHYRYADGYVYRLDPETRLVAAAIELALD
jgi:hypothetical protein